MVVRQATRGGGGNPSTLPAEVYRARDTKLDRDVAIKVLPDEFAKDKERLARFEREAKVLASLNHTNIATLYGLEERDDQQLLVMELVEGETLAERIVGGPIPVDEAVPLFIQIAEGLEAAHEKGVIHRDVKPANIKLTPEGKVIILDFGLAKAFLPDENLSVASSQSPTLTKGTALGTIMGTAAYMSPEQARGKQLDKRTDIWAFGCVLYEALTGRPVFGGESITDVLAAVVKTEPDWQRLPQTVPWRLRDLLRRCLRKDARRRLGDMSAARIDLEDASGEPDASASEPHPTRRPRIAAPVAFALAVGVLAGVLGVWSTTKPAPTEVVRFTIDLPLDQKLSGNYELTNVVAISRDGQRIAYAAETGGATRLHLRAMDEFEARPVSATEGAESPFFSPDGEWVGFFANGQLQKVSWNGELPSTICPIAGFAGGAFWNEDEQIIYSDTGLGIFRVSASGGEPEFLTSADFTKGQITLITPQPLPGRDVLLVTIRTLDGERFGLHYLETGERRVLGVGSRAHYVPTGSVGHLVYTHEGSLRAVPFDASKQELVGEPASIFDGVGRIAASSNGKLLFVRPEAIAGKLVAVTHQGKARTLTDDLIRDGRPRLSPDGTRVATYVDLCCLFVYDVERGTRTRVTGPGNYTPEWTPDGKKIAFFSFQEGARDVFWKSADGTGEAESLLTRDNPQWPSSFSPEGDWLAISELHPVTGWDIWMLPVQPVQGDRSPSPFLVTAANEKFSKFSPDGRFVAFVSDDSGRNEVFILPFPGPGEKVTISPAGGTAPMWSRDGRQLFYRNGEQMLAVDIRYDPTMTVGAPRLLFEAPPDRLTHFADYDVGPDEPGFVMVRPNEGPEQRRMYVVLNWFEELRRLAPER